MTGGAAESALSWQQQLAGAVRSVDELLERVGLDAGNGVSAANNQFPLLVPHSYLERIRPGDPKDPLLLQVLPQRVEVQGAAGFTADPLGETHLSSGGLIHKYHGRLLVIASGACPIHCRYCFRRHYDYSANAAGRERFRKTLEAIRSGSDSDEIILSGGDPLSLSNDKLGELLAALAASANIRRLRVHTRFPVAIPERVDEELVAILRSLAKPLTLVLHINHPNEINPALAAAAARLKPNVAALLNQSVLLRHVNDRVATLVDLSEALFDAGVLPYYLHQLDRVAGAAHFEVGDEEARSLHQQMAARLPGYLVPKLVREEPGGVGKTLL